MLIATVRLIPIALAKRVVVGTSVFSPAQVVSVSLVGLILIAMAERVVVDIFVVQVV